MGSEEEKYVSDFFKFPRIPHLAWLGAGEPRDDKQMSPDEVKVLLSDEVLVEEKLDGANLGISLSSDGQVWVQNRGQYLIEPYEGQFSRLAAWLVPHRFPLMDLLDSSLILFGEWCAAQHALDYDALPDWFLVFDVYDRGHGRFWSTRRRDALAGSLGFAVVPRIFRGKTSQAGLHELLESQVSRFRQGAMEGLVIRGESADWCETRAKLVRSAFVQSIGEHWSRRSIRWNGLQATPPTG
jgi:ATP-dependent RNA circularization protein (DNA/RNA ligase family)